MQAYCLQLLTRNLIADKEFVRLVTDNTFGLLLGEMGDNVREHAEAHSVMVFAQYWSSSNECEICLVDDGQGISGSLSRAGREFTGDLDALQKVIEHQLSAKDESGEMKRGTGIRNTRSVLASNEIAGEFSIVSGNAAYACYGPGQEQLLDLGDYRWGGTIVTMRVKKPKAPFPFYDYVR